jgi:hypothetical protein
MHIVGKDYIYLSVLFKKEVEKRAVASFSGLFFNEGKYIFILTTMYVYCVYPAMSESKTAITFRGSELFFEVKFQF